MRLKGKVFLAWIPGKQESFTVIRSFSDPATEDLCHGRSHARVRRFLPDIMATAQRKMDDLRRAARLDDLKAPLV